MTVHSRQPDHPAEAMLAIYSHAKSSALAEWSYRNPLPVVTAVVVLLFLGISQQSPLGVLLLLAVVGLAGAVMSLREASGNVDRIIREVQEREEGNP